MVRYVLFYAIVTAQNCLEVSLKKDLVLLQMVKHSLYLRSLLRNSTTVPSTFRLESQ